MFRMVMVVALVTALFGASGAYVGAQAAVTVLEDSQRVNFPDNITFTLRVQAPSEITRVRIEYFYATGITRATGNPTFERGTTTTASFELRTGGQNFVPGGAMITYRYLIETADGGSFRTDQKQFVYLDPRYQWRTMADGLVTVYYPQNVSEPRARALLQAAVGTIEAVRQKAGIELQNPTNVVVYNTIQELDSALPFQAAAARESRLGTHFGAFDVVIMVADASAIDTAQHEMTHAIIEDAVNLSTNAFTNFPVWLNEGLATYFQNSQGSEWAPFLQAAIRANRVLQLKDMVTYPGREEEKLLVYAQGVSVVRFLLERYGAERMAQLLAVYREGSTDDAAFQRVYGKNLLAIENEWRQSLNIPLAQPPAAGGPQTGAGPRPVATLPPLDISGGAGGSGSTSPGTGPAQPQPGGPSGAPSQQPAQDPGRFAQALPILALGGGVVVVLLVVVAGAVIINARRNQI